MEADALFLKGTGKAVCKDYATCLLAPGVGAAIISDGCSQSGKSDIGARLLAESFLAVIAETVESGAGVDALAVLDATKARVREAVTPLRLPPGSLDTTLIAAVATDADGLLRVFMWGDGHVVLKRRDGIQHHISVQYANSAPYYLAYEVWPDNAAKYEEIFGPPAPSVLRRCTVGDGSVVEEPIEATPFFHLRYSIEDILSVCVFSDGLDTFSTPEVAEGIPATEILQQLTEFKGYAGEFVRRRMLRFQKKAEADGMTHYDDISCAALAFPDEATP